VNFRTENSSNYRPESLLRLTLKDSAINTLVFSYPKRKTVGF